jgi:hypothetical protein
MTALAVASGFVLLLCAIAHLEDRWPHLFNRIEQLISDDSNQ